MTDILIPPYLRVSQQSVTTVSNSAVGRSVYTGALVTTQRGGDRIRYGLTINNASNATTVAERAKWASVVSSLRGQANRVWYSPADYSQRGSFPSGELITNNTFASGTTGWAVVGGASLSANDRILRIKSIDGSASAGASKGLSSATQYAAYCVRAMVREDNVGVNSAVYLWESASLVAYSLSTSPGLRIASYVSTISSPDVVLYASTSSGGIAGSYAEFSYTSVSRCLLIDNSPNLLTYSDQLNNAAWTKTACSVTANATAGATGATDADSIIEDSSTGTHYIYSNYTCLSSSFDWAMSVELKAGARTWASLQVGDNVLGNMSAYFNLSAGTVGTVSNGAGGWSNARAFIVSLGNGWYRCALVGKKIGASTSTSNYINLATADTTISYAGNGTSNIYARRAAAAYTGLPWNPQITTSAVATGTTQTGARLAVKGLPASTTGLLLEGDMVQIGTQLCRVVSALNSDAAGLGTLQLAYPLFSAPADNDPVIINTPMGKFVAVQPENSWNSSPGVVSNYTLEIEESLA